MASPTRPAPRWPELLAPLLAGDAAAVRDLLSRALRSGSTRAAVFEDVVNPCLREIGRLWQHGELSVPDEHLASETLTGALLELRCPPVTGDAAPTAVVSCAPLEHHCLPALMAADLLTDAGWQVWYLGASAPAAELAAFVRLREPRLLVLTTTMPRTLAGVVTVARALTGERGTAILAGGAGVEDVASPATIGVDALGRRLPDLLRFADTVLGRAARPAGPGWSAASRAPSAAGALAGEHVEVVLREAGTALSLNEIGERCGASAPQVSRALTDLERDRRVRFTSAGRWRVVAGGPG